MNSHKNRSNVITPAMVRQFLCAAGIHKWTYLPNTNGGRPMRRECCCGKRQGWNYSAAREQGVIVWEDVQGDEK